MSILRDISLILLALEGIALTLVFVLILGAINYGLFRFRWWSTLPRWFTLATNYLHLGQRVIERVCRVTVAPIVAVSMTWAGLAEGARGLRATTERWKRP